jgi:hypothetical protein
MTIVARLGVMMAVIVEILLISTQHKRDINKV